MKIITAPGPVSYPLILASRYYRDLDLVFAKGKENESAYAIADSLVSLIKNDLRVDVVTVKGLMFIYPKLQGPRIAVWRRGSAADLLTRALLDRVGLKAELVYADDWYSILNMLNEGKVQSAVLNLGVLEHNDAFLEELVNAPGACGAYVSGNPQYFIDTYTAGIEAAKRSLTDAAEYIARKLPISIPRGFIENILRRVKYGIYDTGNYADFINVVKRYSDA
ncbi:DUF3834 domain-containing protein [Caldivirga sp. UBA161]|uniref:DUF3834 domain-containing protein n=1 Tax=Caldivirga sp. UBA161 TaxID=1915569 RepID=UPI0025C2DE6E|nr:DUF3834 domain-containing protein [Caldivirga sp. UBA161]